MRWNLVLQELTIDNLAIIDHLTLEFNDRMTVLTGETGAGKSIIIDAVSLLAGARSSQELIRRGADKLVVQGQFLIPQDDKYTALLDELGIDHSDGVLIISREINHNGKNVIRVNGTLINTTLLKKVGTPLVDIQGQHDSQRLLQPENHIDMLDQYGGSQVRKLLSKYRDIYRSYIKLQRTIADKQRNEQQWSQRLDMLRYQVKEIEDANLRSGEEDDLISEKTRLEHFQQINNALRELSMTLNDGGEAPVLDQLATVIGDMDNIAEFDDEYAELDKQLNDAYYSLQDVANQASQQMDGMEYDEGRLNEINERFNLISDLEHKYGNSVNDVLSYYHKISQELASMEETAVSADDLQEQFDNTKTELKKAGFTLSKARHQVAKELDKAVHQQLKSLYMGKADFEVVFHEESDDYFTSTGVDNVEFYIQTNPGEKKGPLAKIASGGELSRVMLALKTIFAQTEGVTSIIFDEVDTGVSGRVAQAIADKIRMIAEHSQVLCITHLPQVAAVAQHQFLISKNVQKDRTMTSVHLLNREERVNELARMLAGEKITKLTKEHAEELLKMAK